MSLKQSSVNQRKMNLIRQTAQERDDPNLLYTLNKYFSLSYENLQTICAFKSREWFNWGSCKEYEYLDNRKPEDRDIQNTHGGTENGGWFLLTEELYNKSVSTPTILSYNLYLLMRLAELKRM